MRTRWLRLAVAVAIALTTALSWGWMNHQRIDPHPRLWLDPDSTVRVQGLEFSNPTLTTVDPPTEGLTEYPDGAVIAIATFTVEVVAPPVDEYSHYCFVELQTPAGVYTDDKSFSSGAGLPHTCDSDADGEPLSVGDSQTVTAGWVVPAPPPEGSTVLVRILEGNEVLGIRY